MQDILQQWFTMHGECYFIRYFAVPQRQQKEDSVDLIACVCSLADYQRIFVTTYNNSLLMKAIDYCWTGAMFAARLCDIRSKFDHEILNHNRFSQDRVLNASIPLKPGNALHVGLKKAVKDTEMMSMFKKNWVAPPENFKTAINWKAFDYWHFAIYSTWPEDGKHYGPLNEPLSMPRHGVV